MHNAIPRLAQAEGVTDSKKAPTLKDSPLPVKSISASLVSRRTKDKGDEGGMRWEMAPRVHISRTCSDDEQQRGYAVCGVHGD